MHFHNIEIENFGAYSGKHKIDFAYKGEKNVTIIQGEQGSGKSSILNAFYWCFYDKIWINGISNFREKPSTTLVEARVINSDVFLKAAEEEKGYTVKVSIKFTAKEKDYKLTRYANIDFINGEFINQTPKKTLKLEEWDRDGDYTPDTLIDAEITAKIEEVFPPSLGNYFLYRGENKAELVKLNNHEKFQSAVKKLSKLELFIRSEKHLKDIWDQYKRERDDDLEDVMLKSQIKDCNDVISALNESKERLEILYNKCKVGREKAKGNLEKVQKELDKTKEDREILNTIDKKEKDNKDFKKDKDKNIGKFNENIYQRWLFTSMSDTIESFHSHYQQRVDVGDFPPNIRKDFLEDLIDNKNNCICGTEHTDNTKAHLKAYLEDCVKHDNEFVQNLAKLDTTLSDIQDAIKDYPEAWKNDDNEITNLEGKIRENDKTIESLRSQIKNADTKNLEETRDTLNKDIGSLNEKIDGEDGYLSKIDTLKRNIKTERETLTKLEDRISEDSPINKFCTVAGEIHSISRDTLDKYENRIFTELEKNVISNWSNIIYDMRNYRKIKLDKKEKEFDVFDDNDISTYEIMNTGHAILFTLSIVAGLMKITDDSWGEKMPITFDAPLSECGTSYIPKAIEGITEIFNQSILILQDKTLDSDTKDLIKHKIGEYYEIAEDENRHPQIRKNTRELIA